MTVLTLRQFHVQFGGRLKTISYYKHLYRVIADLRAAGMIPLEVLEPPAGPGFGAQVHDPEALLQIINERPDHRRKKTNWRSYTK